MTGNPLGAAAVKRVRRPIGPSPRPTSKARRVSSTSMRGRTDPFSRVRHIRPTAGEKELVGEKWSPGLAATLP